MSAQVLSKVKDLLSLSDGNTNVNEAAAAYKAAQRLLSQHRLTMADVYASAEKEARELITQGDKPLYTGTRAITWRGSLAKGICNANGCDVYWDGVFIDGDWKRQLVVVGRPSDIEVVTYLYHAVASQIEAMCSAAMLANRGGGKTFSNNFKLGAVNTVSSRLREAAEEVEEEYQGTKALVLVKKDNEELKLAMSKLKLRKRKVASRYDRSGYKQGQAAGRRVNLSRAAIGGGKPRGLLN